MSELKVNSVLDANGGNTATINGFAPSVSNMAGRNRIINGGMTIDQRNAGAAVTASAAGTYFGVDRTLFFKNSSANFTIQQSSIAPQGFNKSLSATVTSAASSSGAQSVVFQHNIEGFNAADLNFGTASASAITLSFWVRSSLAGTYCVTFRNVAFNRSYVAEYTINAANTWEYKTISVSGDTTGTWETGTSTGLRVAWDLGSGTDSNGTAGSWAASAATRTTNQVNWANTSGATFYLTGVQLEAGSVATPFEYRPYGQELALCQRYGLRIEQQQNSGAISSALTSTNVRFTYPTTMRATPTAALITAGSWIVGNDFSANYTAASASLTAANLSPSGGRVQISGFPLFGSNLFVAGTDAVGTAVLFLSAEL